MRESRPRAAPPALIVALSWALWSLCAVAAGQSEAGLNVAAKLDGEPPGDSLALLEDPGGKLSLDDVQRPEIAARFHKARHQAPSLGYTSSVYWLRFSVYNPRADRTSWLLEVAYPHLDELTLFMPQPDGRYAARVTGDAHPFGTRPILHRTFVFALEEPPHGEAVYFLRVATTSSMSLRLKTWTPASFVGHLPRDLGMLCFFYGIALAMAAYHLCAYAFIRKGELLVYAAQMLCMGFMQLTMSGHSFQFLTPNQPWLSEHLLEWSCALVMAAACQVSAFYMGVERTLPRIDRSMRMAAAASIGLGLVSLFTPYRLSILMFAIAAIAIVLCGHLMCIYLVYKQIHRAKLYLMAWSSMVMGVCVLVLNTYGILPNNLFTTWAFHIGASIQMVLLSSALADWTNSLRSDLGHLNQALSQKVAALEAALKQAEHATTRAEEATRTKAEFVATMSHELRTPLNAIINVPQGLLKDFPRALAVVCDGCGSTFELERGERVTQETPCPECAKQALKPSTFVKYNGRPEKTAHYLALIERSGKHLLQMVNSILDSSKIDAGRLVLTMEHFELPALLAEVVDEMSDAAQRAGVSIALDCAANLEAIRADPLRIKQVLINLLSNAIKFSDGRGPIVMAVNPGKRGGCVVSVRDRGIGIAREDFERIFANFEQVHKGNTRKYGGTGLGLPISRQLVRMHGGDLWVESELDHGTTFFFSLPGSLPQELASSTVPLDEPARPSISPRASSQELSS